MQSINSLNKIKNSNGHFLVFKINLNLFSNTIMMKMSLL